MDSVVEEVLMNDVAERIRKRIAEIPHCFGSSLEGEKSLKDVGIDSLDLFELQFELEKEFRIEIPDEDLAKMKTIQDVVNYVSGQLYK